MEEWEKRNEATNNNQKELTWELCSSHLDLVLSPLKQKHTSLLFCLLLLLSSFKQLQSCKKEARIVQKDIDKEERQYMQQYIVLKNHC